MAGFEFIDHTADVRARCRGTTFHDLLVSAARALYAVALREMRDDTPLERAFTLAADREPEHVLVQFLREVLYRLDVERFVAVWFRFEPPVDADVTVRMGGYACAPEDRETEVKAVTYHGMTVARDATGFTADVLFDL